MRESTENLRVSDAGSTEDRFAARLRGFGPLGILAILIILGGNFVIEPLSAILALIWAKISNTPWREIGYVRPRSWTKTIALGTILGVVFKFAMKAVVMPLFGAPPINQAFQFATGNPAVIPAMLYTIILGAGFGEETLFRGWMFERLGKLFGQSAPAKIAIVLITSLLFAAAHLPGQGIPGAEQALVVGIVFASIFAVTGQIFLLMIAHTAFDLTALWMIYYDLETPIARLIFKTP
ncbi:MAG TPA: CPBP family intramembrane glutamic endopeptidase [Chthoniobacterales bacterium]|nr:CPBP family intramembrane glutamic endopeptidase [Chthoniobacterales bacterium]